MKKLMTLSAIVCFAALSLSPSMFAQESRLAIKRFYEANQSTSFPTTGFGPRALAFDGQNIWAVNASDGTLTVLRASDGNTMCTVGLGGAPSGIAYDGAFIWVADSADNQVFAVQANTCDPDAVFTGVAPSVVAYPLPTGATAPHGVAFDGTAIWVANSGSNNVTRIPVQGGAPNGAMTNYSAAGLVGPTAIAYDGSHIWVANSTSSVTVLYANGSPAADLGNVFCQKAIASSAVAFAYDGVETMWTAYGSAGGYIVKILNATGCPVSNNIPTGVNSSESDIVFDGTDVWVAMLGTGSVVKLVPGGATGATPVGTFAVGGITGLAFDGTNVWASEFSAGAFGNGLILKL